MSNDDNNIVIKMPEVGVPPAPSFGNDLEDLLEEELNKED